MKVLSVILLCMFITTGWSQESDESQEQPKKEAKKESDFQAERKELNQDIDLNKVTLLGIADYSSASASSGTTLTGPGFQFQFIYGVTPKWGVGLSARQSFDTGGSTLATNFSAHLTYSFNESLHRRNRKVTLGDLGVGSIQEYSKGGWRAQFIINQYYYNGTANTVPYSGMGASVYYEFPSRGSYSYVAGFRFDSAGNQGNTITVMFGYVGLSWWY